MIWVQYCHIDELDSFQPTIAKEIRHTRPKEKLPLVRPPFVYSITKTDYVWRVDIEDYKMYGFFRGLTESSRHADRLATAQAQTRLTDLEGPRAR